MKEIRLCPGDIIVLYFVGWLGYNAGFQRIFKLYTGGLVYLEGLLPVLDRSLPTTDFFPHLLLFSHVNVTFAFAELWR